jgi:hypothetical protein
MRHSIGAGSISTRSRLRTIGNPVSERPNLFVRSAPAFLFTNATSYKAVRDIVPTTEAPEDLEAFTLPRRGGTRSAISGHSHRLRIAPPALIRWGMCCAACQWVAGLAPGGDSVSGPRSVREPSPTCHDGSLRFSTSFPYHHSENGRPNRQSVSKLAQLTKVFPGFTRSKLPSRPRQK